MAVLKCFLVMNVMSFMSCLEVYIRDGKLYIFFKVPVINF